MLLARLFLLQPERPPDCSLVTAVDWSERKSQRDLDTSNQVVWPGECMNTTSCFVPFCAHRSVGGWFVKWSDASFFSPTKWTTALAVEAAHMLVLYRRRRSWSM